MNTEKETSPKSPRNLDEAVAALDGVISPEDKERFQEWTEEKFVTVLHHSLGQWVRNNWKLWDDTSELSEWFEARKIWHADDMSGIVLRSYYRKTRDLPIKFEEQVQGYVEYWKKYE